jgi:hypothetical protein
VVAESTRTFYGQAMTAGHICSLVGGLLAPTDVVADAAVNLVVVDSEQYQILVLADKTGSFYGQMRIRCERCWTSTAPATCGRSWMGSHTQAPPLRCTWQAIRRGRGPARAVLPRRAETGPARILLFYFVFTIM